MPDDDDATMAALLAAQNRDTDPDGEHDADDLGDAEEYAEEDPRHQLPLDAADTFEDLHNNPGDDTEDDLDDDA